ncbi:MAG: UDP-3-O-[3-hydroxymyristoyl] glucosamine N-acyltransferase [Urechidicola sp.]
MFFALSLPLRSKSLESKVKSQKRIMKFKKPQTLREIAKLVNVPFIGDENFEILGINEIHVVEKGDIVFVDHPKYYDKALNSAATTILINKQVTCPDGKTLLISEDPFRDFNKITKHFNPFMTSKKSVSESATIGQGTIIQPNVFIGNNVIIGNNCVIHPNVTIYDNSVIGNNVHIHANTVLGADAFYYKNRPTGFDQLISGGRVVLKDDVDLGASCTIDRGVTGDTIIGAGTKIDNQVHVGHDTIIGEKCLIASQTGIAGCVIIEDEVTIWGQVGTNSGITIGKGAIILGQTGVTKSVAGGKSYFGTPISESRAKLKEMAEIKRFLKDRKNS